MENSAKKEPDALQKEVIELCLPKNPAYVATARLTASSIAIRAGFDVTEIEDIKAAVSEGCAYLIKATHHSHATDGTTFCIRVEIVREEINITFHTRLFNLSVGDSATILLIIKAYMDEAEISEIDGCFKLTMQKRHRVINFEA